MRSWGGRPTLKLEISGGNYLMETWTNGMVYSFFYKLLRYVLEAK